MCEGCKEIIVGKKSIIRQAAFKNKNDFVEANELISIIHYKFFNWKRKQEGPIKVNNSFFHRIAHNAAIDEIREYDVSIDSSGHESLVEEMHFKDPSSFVLALRIMKDCSSEEKDAVISIANKEQPEEFAKRYGITYANAVQKRRRAINKIRERLFSNNVEKSYA